MRLAMLMGKGGLRVMAALPKETNTEKCKLAVSMAEDRYITAKNKGLFVRFQSREAAGGAVVGLAEKNIDIANYI